MKNINASNQKLVTGTVVDY